LREVSHDIVVYIHFPDSCLPSYVISFADPGAGGIHTQNRILRIVESYGYEMPL